MCVSKCECNGLQQKLRFTDHFGMHMVGGQRGWVERVERMRARNFNLLRVAWQICCAECLQKNRPVDYLLLFLQHSPVSSMCCNCIFYHQHIHTVNPEMSSVEQLQFGVDTEEGHEVLAFCPLQLTLV